MFIRNLATVSQVVDLHCVDASFELIIRFIDWFYRRPVSALLPRQTFRYAVCGGANVVFGWGCYFLLYNFVLDRLLDLGFIAVSPHVAAMLIVFR